MRTACLPRCLPGISPVVTTKTVAGRAFRRSCTNAARLARHRHA